MNVKRLSFIGALIMGSIALAQVARAEDPVTGLVKGVGGAVNQVGTEAGRGVTDVLDHVTGNHTPGVNPPSVAPSAAPVVVHHHHHHHHHHH